MQFVAGLIVLGNTAGFALSIYGLTSYAGSGVADIWVRLAWGLCIVLALLLMLWQLPKRSRIGRNIGLAMIAFLAYGAISSRHGVSSPSIFFTAGQWSATVFLVMILAYWAYAFAFSKKARRYFSVTGND